jgi:hypothetical protein
MPNALRKSGHGDKAEVIRGDDDFRFLTQADLVRKPTSLAVASRGMTDT